jgi:hypothetical protein
MDRAALAVAHPFDDGTAGVLARSIDETADALGADGAAGAACLVRSSHIGTTSRPLSSAPSSVCRVIR